jgi:hypothetical protein
LRLHILYIEYMIKGKKNKYEYKCKLLRLNLKYLCPDHRQAGRHLCGERPLFPATGTEAGSGALPGVEKVSGVLGSGGGVLG